MPVHWIDDVRLTGVGWAINVISDARDDHVEHDLLKMKDSWLVVWSYGILWLSIQLGIIIPTECHIVQRGWNHQPVSLEHTPVAVLQDLLLHSTTQAWKDAASSQNAAEVQNRAVFGWSQKLCSLRPDTYWLVVWNIFYFPSYMG